MASARSEPLDSKAMSDTHMKTEIERCGNSKLLNLATKLHIRSVIMEGPGMRVVMKSRPNEMTINLDMLDRDTLCLLYRVVRARLSALDKPAGDA